MSTIKLRKDDSASSFQRRASPQGVKDDVGGFFVEFIMQDFTSPPAHAFNTSFIHRLALFAFG
ncbi:hypothetical protein FRC02_006750 [Tulasnella sp. 418]|nr:hypothetical protein FRC02_006750 [Tulasnella sp. 418]